MIYRIEIAATARAELQESARWLRDQVSTRAADRWLSGLMKTIRSLETNPLRCPKAIESNRFPREIRELSFGNRKNSKYRILFEVVEGTVFIVHIRHSARDEWEP